MTANRKTMIKALSTIISIVEKSTTCQSSHVRFRKTRELAPLLAYELRNKQWWKTAAFISSTTRLFQEGRIFVLSGVSDVHVNEIER